MKRWLAIALMLIAAGTSSALADTTAKYALSNAGWTDLGPGPMLLSFNGPTGVFAISDATPTLKAEGFGKARGGSIRVVTPSHVWATATGNYGVTAYVAPITAPATGGATSVWSAADATASGMTLSNGGLTATGPGVVGYNSIRGTISKTSGKLYVEFLAVAAGGNGVSSNGVANSTINLGVLLGQSNYSAGAGWSTLGSAGFTVNYALGTWAGTGAVVGMAIDFAAGKMWIAFDNVWFNGSNPGVGSLPIFSFVPATVGALFPALTMYNAGEIWTLQPTPASQKYAPPGGFQAWDGGPVSKWTALAATSIGTAGPTPAIDTTGADLLVAIAAGGGAISDNKGNTWTLAGTSGSAAFSYCRGCTVGTGHTITQSSSTFPGTAFAAFSGSAASPADQFLYGGVGSAGPITPTVPNALVVTGNCSNGLRPGDPPPAGFSTLATVGVGANFGAGLAYQQQTTPAAVTATWAGGNPCGTTIMSFKPQ
jgi:hypothetical protein